MTKVVDRRSFFKTVGIGVIALCVDPSCFFESEKRRVEYIDITKTIDKYMLEAISKGTSVTYDGTFRRQKPIWKLIDKYGERY